MSGVRWRGWVLVLVTAVGWNAAAAQQPASDAAAPAAKAQPAAKPATRARRTATPTPPPPPPDTRADSADQGWLAMVDAGQYGESWKATAAAFQASIPQDKWEEALTNVRAPLGKMSARKLEDAKFSTSLPGVPDGEYIVAIYATSFANKAEAHEMVTATHEKDGSWKVSGYFIN